MFVFNSDINFHRNGFYSGDLIFKLVWYLDHGELFDHRIVRYSDAMVDRYSDNHLVNGTIKMANI